MSKIGFVFPGQGAQYVGMGRNLYENFEIARELFDITGNILGQDLSKVCFEGPESELIKTENTQPAILTVSIAAANVLMAKGIKPDILAGFSLGEYSALVAAKAFRFEDVLALVRKRAQLIQQAVPLGEGGMAVIVGLDSKQVEECCSQASQLGAVQPSNYNAPCQITISGKIEALELACEFAKKAGAKQVVKLPVSAPFHSSLLTGSGEELLQYLYGITLKAPRMPVISNVNARPYFSVSDIPLLLSKQVSHPVRWEECIRYMIDCGTKVFIEVGPGKVLSRLIKKIDTSVKTCNVEDDISLQYTIDSLKRGAA